MLSEQKRIYGCTNVGDQWYAEKDTSCLKKWMKGFVEVHACQLLHDVSNLNGGINS